MKDLLTILEENNDDCFQSYRNIAEKLMNGYLLQVNTNFYRIVECEFYYSSSKHPDPYVHGHERQKTTLGEWYFHGSGLDITLANGKAYGGILLRGIVKISTNGSGKIRREDAIIGPLNICTEIFKQVGSVTAQVPLIFGLVEAGKTPIRQNLEQAKIFAIPRINLNSTKDNDGQYCKRPYRFISFLHLPHKEVEKVKKYLTEEAGERISMYEYKEYYSGKKY